MRIIAIRLLKKIYPPKSAFQAICSFFKKWWTTFWETPPHIPQRGGRITVKVWQAAEKAHLTIENTGVHIPDEDIPKLFEAFYRVDQSRNRQTGGTGLGLYIVKIILDLHGAAIEIKNTSQGVMVSAQF